MDCNEMPRLIHNSLLYIHHSVMTMIMEGFQKYQSTIAHSYLLSDSLLLTRLVSSSCL